MLPAKNAAAASFTCLPGIFVSGKRFPTVHLPTPFWREEAGYHVNGKVSQHAEVYNWEFQFLMLFFISFLMSRISMFILGKHVYPRVPSWEYLG